MPNFEAERQIIARQAYVRLNEILNSVFTQQTPITDVEACVTGPDRGPEQPPKSGFKPFEIPGHWGGFDQTTWFRLRTAIPEGMRDQRVVAMVWPQGESLAIINGHVVGGLDHHHRVFVLADKAKKGQKFEILLEGVPSTQFDLTRDFEYAHIAVMNDEAWAAYWDFKAVLDVWMELDPNSTQRLRLIDLLDRSIKMVDLNAIGEPAYEQSLTKARRALARGLKKFPSERGSGQLTLIGHSHIDTAWLWPIRETERKCGRTFGTVLSLMDRYPEYHFSCSQPVQYEITKKFYPELYERICERVKEGRWEPNGCFWVEPDLNIPSGESLVRQAVYGNRVFRKEFGIHSRVAWTPDTFGYCYALPQILKKAQVDYFVTTKIHWNQFTHFPYTFFQWEGADGSRVLTVRPWDYNGNIIPKSLIKQFGQHAQRDRTDTFMFPYGWGDGGGGPTPEMLEMGRRMKNIVGVPQCEFGTTGKCLEDMASECDTDQLPVWNGELYFELHRGCQTTQAQTKRNNRKAELTLRDAEFLSAWSMVYGGDYDQEALYEIWKVVLTNQFHDILPGSSINEVYRRSEAEMTAAIAGAAVVRDKALADLDSRVDSSGEGTPLLVVNTLPWPRQDVAVIDVKKPRGTFSVVDADGDPVLWQWAEDGSLLIDTNNVPAMGHAVYRIVKEDLSPEWVPTLKATPKGMENELLRLRFNKFGNLTSVYDKMAEREVLPKGKQANVLQFFEDRPNNWEAWDIDFNFEESMWTAGEPESVTVTENGPLRVVVRMVYKTGKSIITQDVVLYAFSQRVDFVTHVDWQERRTLLKAAFPVDIRSPRATFEVQFATVERPTHTNRDSDLAQFEVPAQKWADLSEGNYGVSLLNDCKYGYDVKGNVLRLSLLRSPMDPDPKADEGEHRFTYSLYPHEWDWRNGAVQEAFELNVPLLAREASGTAGSLPSVYSFFSCDADHVVVDTVKRAEDSSVVIVRLYEAYGERGDVSLTFDKEPIYVTECDLMEENDIPLKIEGDSVSFPIAPYEIRTFKVTF